MSTSSQNPSLPSLLAYHQRTKHHFAAYAEGPGQLDWDAQPAPFRHYPGSPLLELPLSGDQFERPYAELLTPPTAPIAADLTSLGALLELSFGLSAWKSWGSSRWALRCNPSSGNLHPVEAYVLSNQLPGITSGVHHYDPENHVLEGRALLAPSGVAWQTSPWLAIGISSVMWREAWKYGERAFRYCQLDVGHAIATLAYAAALLGWELRPLTLPSGALAHLLGLDREDDFPSFPSSRYAYTDDEEPEILLTIRASQLSAPADGAALLHWLTEAQWHGQPSQIDPSPSYRWPVVTQAAQLSRISQSAQETAALPPASSALPPLGTHSTKAGSAELIRQRRSAQRFDPKQTLDKAAFYRLLDATLPRPQLPFAAHDSVPTATPIHLLLFVLRVAGLSPGLYLLPRSSAAALELPPLMAAGNPHFAPRPVAEFDPDCPSHLGLIQLCQLGLQELQRLARALSCHQDIAATSAFSLGMLADFAPLESSPDGYRQLLREAGLIGQVLYLEAEAASVRGTGIGCFFDDPVQQAFGISDNRRWQSVYHFTIGSSISDERIETGPPYPQRTQT